MFVHNVCVLLSFCAAAGPQTYNLPPAGMPPVPGPPPGLFVVNNAMSLLVIGFVIAGRMPPPGMPPGMMGRGMPPPGMPPPGMPPQGPPGLRGNFMNRCKAVVSMAMAGQLFTCSTGGVAHLSTTLLFMYWCEHNCSNNWYM